MVGYDPFGLFWSTNLVLEGSADILYCSNSSCENEILFGPLYFCKKNGELYDYWQCILEASDEKSRVAGELVPISVSEISLRKALRLKKSGRLSGRNSLEKISEE